jgi:hypothetical protein
MPPGRLTVRALALALPAIFALHVVEEAPGFVMWFNAHVEPDITAQSFWSVNASAFAITIAVAAVAAISRERVAALVAIAWVGFLMLANGLFHVVAAVVDRGYVPGVVTALLLYLPFSVSFLRTASVERGIPPGVAVAVALAGGIPMVVHGWRVLFESGRLF